MKKFPYLKTSLEFVLARARGRRFTGFCTCKVEGYCKLAGTSNNRQGAIARAPMVVEQPHRRTQRPRPWPLGVLLVAIITPASYSASVGIALRAPDATDRIIGGGYDRQTLVERDPMETIQVHNAGTTDHGRNRERNEDHFLIADLNKSMQVHETSLRVNPEEIIFSGAEGHLYVVADGIGGDAARERASELAIETMSQYILNVLPWFFRLSTEAEDELYGELKRAVSRCEEVIESEGEAVPGHAGMGTTLTVAFVLWPKLYVVHVGDSRCYLLRGKKLEQITRDHTMIQSLVEQGV